MLYEVITEASSPGDGGDLLDRAGLDQPGDGGGARACQPPAGALDPVRRVRGPRPRPGVAADRGLRRRHGERQP